MFSISQTGAAKTEKSACDQEFFGLSPRGLLHFLEGVVSVSYISVGASNGLEKSTCFRGCP